MIKMVRNTFDGDDVLKLNDKFEAIKIETYNHKPILLNDNYPFEYDYEVIEEINLARSGDKDKINYLINYYNNQNEEDKKNYWVNKLTGNTKVIENKKNQITSNDEIVKKIKVYNLKFIETKLLNRGLEVYKKKQINNIRTVNKTIFANCEGSKGETYTISINYINEKLNFKCDCPASFRSIPFCKHVIALIKTIQDDESLE